MVLHCLRWDKNVKARLVSHIDYCAIPRAVPCQLDFTSAQKSRRLGCKWASVVAKTFCF